VCTPRARADCWQSMRYPLPQFLAAPARRHEPWALDILHRFHPHVLPTWRQGQHALATNPVQSLEYQRPLDVDTIASIQSDVKPDWTTVAHLWYTSTRDALSIIEAAGQHTQHLVVQCCGTRSVQDLPEDVLVGYDCRLSRRGSPLPPPPVEQLLDRRVVLLGGEPHTQWRIYCALILQGVDVVCVRLSSNWYMTGYSGKRYWGPDLYETPTKSKQPKEALVSESLRNVLSFWESGLVRARAALSLSTV